MPARTRETCDTGRFKKTEANERSIRRESGRNRKTEWKRRNPRNRMIPTVSGVPIRAENTRFGCSLLLLAYLSITPLATIVSAHLCWFPCPCPVIFAIFCQNIVIDSHANEKKINQRKTRARDATTRTNNPHNTNQKSCIRTEIMVRVVGRMPLYSWNHNNANILHTCEWMLYVCVVLC